MAKSMLSLRFKNMDITHDIRRAGRASAEAINRLQHQRLETIVAFARERSAFCRRHYRDCPERFEDLSALPPVTKHELMENFDAWVTDPAVKREELDLFVSDLDLVGTDFLGKYMVFTSSGTTGEKGILLHDRFARRIYYALYRCRTNRAHHTLKGFVRLLRRRFRIAAVIPMCGHFGAFVSFARLHAGLKGSRRNRL
jgi:phenylacetate-CoA ligase